METQEWVRVRVLCRAPHPEIARFGLVRALGSCDFPVANQIKCPHYSVIGCVGRRNESHKYHVAAQHREHDGGDVKCTFSATSYTEIRKDCQSISSNNVQRRGQLSTVERYASPGTRRSVSNNQLAPLGRDLARRNSPRNSRIRLGRLLRVSA